MANYLMARSNKAFLVNVKNIWSPMKMKNDVHCVWFSSCSNNLQTSCILSPKIQNNVAQFHTSCAKREIFNIQDEEDFKTRVLNSKKSIIVDFHAKWCGPCKVLMPRLEGAVIASKEKIDLAKVDIDDLPDIAMQYNVGAVPSVLVIKNGTVVDKFVGLKDDDQIGTFIASAIKT